MAELRGWSAVHAGHWRGHARRCVCVSTASMLLASVVTVSLFSRSVGVCRCFREKVGGRSRFGVYTCAPSATVRPPRRIVWRRGPSRRSSGVRAWCILPCLRGVK